MSDQISLFGSDPASVTAIRKPATDRLFFAVIPDADAIPAIRLCATRFQSQYNLSQHPIIDGRLHISLLGLGDYAGLPELEMKAASRAAAMIAPAAFDVCFDKVLTFTRQNAAPSEQLPFVLIEGIKSKGWATLQRSLKASAQKVGLAEGAPSGFNPHVTLLYDRQRLPEIGVEPIMWRVKEFVLVRSEIGDSSRPYDILARWPLVG